LLHPPECIHLHFDSSMRCVLCSVAFGVGASARLTECRRSAHELRGIDIDSRSIDEARVDVGRSGTSRLANENRYCAALVVASRFSARFGEMSNEFVDYQPIAYRIIRRCTYKLFPTDTATRTTCFSATRGFDARLWFHDEAVLLAHLISEQLVVFNIISKTGKATSNLMC